MKKMLVMLMVLCCTSCTALPAEERAFAVALCIEKAGDVWQVYGRIPAYKADGEYLTVKGQGAMLDTALADMDASAPMKVTLSQLRLLMISAETEISDVLTVLAGKLDLRPQCVVAVTDEPAGKIMEALSPQSGSRLSKAIDLLVESRTEQGVIPDARLADVVRMGERQTPVFARAALKENQIDLTGAWAAGEWLTPEETALLSLLMGNTRELRLALPQGTSHVREAKVDVVLSVDGSSARVTLQAEATESDIPLDALERHVADAALALVTRLSHLGCDALGVGRQHVCHYRDMMQWHEADWPGKYREIRWQVEVGLNGPA